MMLIDVAMQMVLRGYLAGHRQYAETSSFEFRLEHYISFLLSAAANVSALLSMVGIAEVWIRLALCFDDSCQFLIRSGTNYRDDGRAGGEADMEQI